MNGLLLPLDASALINGPTADLKVWLLDLLCTLAYKEGDFVLSSGQRSRYYINGKQVTLHPQGALLVGRLLLEVIDQDAVAVAGLTLGADPMVTAVSLAAMHCDRTLFPLIVRKQAKGHGTQAYIEGVALPSGSRITVIEDVVTTGQSAMQAVERLRAAGYAVSRVVSLIDRQQGGADLYRDQQLEFSALFTIAELQRHWQTLSAPDGP